VASSEVASVSVVLLGREGPPRAQLRHALDDLGALVLHEGGLVGADCDELVALQPSVVLVNLDNGVEDALGDLEPLFDLPGVNVVFNEPESSAQLSGWDLARWARHLAAKILGTTDTAPPAPPGAEPLARSQFLPEPGAPPTPEQEVGEVGLERFHEEAAGIEFAVPSSRNLTLDEIEPIELDGEVDATAAPAWSASASGDADFAPFDGDQVEVAEEEVADLHGDSDIVQLEGDSIVVDRVLDESVPREHVETPEVTALEGFHDAESRVGDELELPNVERVEALHGGEVETDDFSLDLEAIEDSLTVLDNAEATLDADEGSIESLELSFDLDFDKDPPRRFASSDDDIGEIDLGMDDDLAALAAQLDAMAPEPLPDAVVEPDFSRAEADPDARAVDHGAVGAAADTTSSMPREGALGDLSLAPIDEDDTEATSVAAPRAAPATAARTYDFSGLSLSLAPIDEAGADDAVATAAPARVASSIPDSGLSLEAIDDGAAESVDSSTPVPESAVASGTDDFHFVDDEDEEVDNTIHRVVVLAASIGGPDALRSFLTSLPEGFPALVLLCQHLDNGFFTRLAQQLQKVSKLPVRVADDGAGPVRPGQVVIVPSDARYSFGEDGRITVSPHDAPPRYQPCIDDLMRDVADRFGRRVTGIIFSGMAGDAIEGSVHITVRGGEVWAQDPDSCVVSSMVDGARARGVVEFVGSPRELAEQCVRRFDRRVTEE
jgi:chemotaxis response regulator CheB